MKMQDDVYTPLQRWHKQYKHIKVRQCRRTTSLTPACEPTVPPQLA